MSILHQKSVFYNKINYNIQESENDYIHRTYLEKFRRYSGTAEAWLKQDGTVVYNTLPYILKPQTIFEKNANQQKVFAINPSHDGLANMMWWDFDCHGKIDPEITTSAANKVFDFLRTLRLTPEVACSGAFGDYHIASWFKIPSTLKYCETVQRNILKHLGLSGDHVEVGPMNGMRIRPWHFGNEFKQRGSLIARGEQSNDLSELLPFYIPDIVRKPMKQPIGKSFKFDLSNYIPDGVSKKRYSCLKRLVTACKKNNFSFDVAKEYAVNQFQTGVVKGSVETHIKEFERLFNDPWECSNSWQSFWDVLPKGLKDDELFRRVQAKAGDKPFACSNRMYANYRNISQPAACGKLHRLEHDGILELVERGISGVDSGKATLYRYGERR